MTEIKIYANKIMSSYWYLLTLNCMVNYST